MDNLKHLFMRHGDNRGHLLTSLGLEEAKQAHKHLVANNMSLNEVSLYSADNKQSITSITLAVFPYIANELIDNVGQALLVTKKLTLDSRLRYIKFGPNDKAIRDEFQLAYDNGTTMQYYVETSDKFLAIKEYSTYLTISQSMANLLLSHCELGTDTLNCAKQFHWPVFHAKLIEHLRGKQERDNFVSWYCQFKELKPEARQDIGTIRTNNGSTFVLRDDYEELIFPLQALKSLQRGCS